VIDANKEINRDFALELNNSMNAIAFKSNLSTEPDKALYSINKRVKSKTRGKIVKFLAAGTRYSLFIL
jgi:serine protease inhibitor